MKRIFACLVAFVLFPLIARAQTLSHDMVPGFGGGVEGRVIDNNGEPVQGAVVYAILLGPPARSRPPKTKTNSNGRFFLDSLEQGKNEIHAYKLSLGYPDTDGAFFVTSPGAISEVEVHEGKVARDLVVRLGPKGGWLSGHVEAANTHEPVARASILLQWQDDPRIYVITEPTDARASFNLLVPSRKLLRMEVSARGYETWYYGTDGTSPHAKPISLAPSSVKEIVIVLQPQNGPSK